MTEGEVATPKRTGFIREIMDLPTAETILGGSGAAVLFGFVFTAGWGNLLHSWHVALAFAGATIAVTLLVFKMIGIKSLPAAVQDKVIVGCASLPAVGYLIEQLQNTWSFLMVAGTVGMAYAAYRIMSRDGMFFFKRSTRE